MIAHNQKVAAGRVSRQTYVLGFVLPTVVTFALGWAGITGAVGEFSQNLVMLSALGWTALFAYGDALNIARWHDIGHSGAIYRLARPFLIGLPILAFVLDFLLPAQMASLGDMPSMAHMIGKAMQPSIGVIPMALLVLTGAGALLNVLYLSFVAGQATSNTYGPPTEGGRSMPGASDDAGASSADDAVARALADYQRRQTAAAAPAAPGAKPSPPSAAPTGFGKRKR